jgi:hypothetical protein
MKGRRYSFHYVDSLRTNMVRCAPNNSTLFYTLFAIFYVLSLMYIHYSYKFMFCPESISSCHCLTGSELSWQVNTVLELEEIVNYILDETQFMFHCINWCSDFFTVLRNYLFLFLPITCHIKVINTAKVVDIIEIYILFHVLLRGDMRGCFEKTDKGWLKVYVTKLLYLTDVDKN